MPGYILFWGDIGGLQGDVDRYGSGRNSMGVDARPNGPIEAS